MTTPMDYTSRIEKLQKKLRRKKIEAILISQPDNRRYLSGFTAFDHNIGESSGHLLIPARGKGYLLTDFRYELQAETEVSHLKIATYPQGLVKLLRKLLPKVGVASLAFESHYTLHSSAAALTAMLDKLKISHTPLSDIVEAMRIVKDSGEIEAIRRSVKLNEEVFQAVYPQINGSMSEIDVALAIEQEMRLRGAERTSFDSIVASGSNSALPHAVPTLGKIKRNKPLTIDMGLVLDGYCSDMTRTFVPGKAGKKYKKLHRLVRKAMLAGMESVKEGVTGKEVDTIARDIIAAEGYGDNFGHSLGHGVGLAVHEAPRVSKTGAKKLKAGMIVTIEPGIYIPGWGGLRLENMVLVKKKGWENLNSDTTWLDI